MYVIGLRLVPASDSIGGHCSRKVFDRGYRERSCFGKERRMLQWCCSSVAAVFGTVVLCVCVTQGVGVYTDISVWSLFLISFLYCFPVRCFDISYKIYRKKHQSQKLVSI